MIQSPAVSISVEDQPCAYPRKPPFHPPSRFPEYPFETECDPANSVYALVRDSLIALRLDEKNLGTKSWNPLRGVIAPGTTVLVKPNLVKHYHNTGKSVDSMIVHGSVIRVVLDYVWLALGGRGKIIVADTPLEKTDFAAVCRLNGLSETVALLKNIYALPIELLDLRSSRTLVGKHGRVISEESLPGDPLGYELVDLGCNSELSELDAPETNYHTLGDHSVDHYNPRTVERGLPNQYHNAERHAYSIGRTILNADTVISIAKLKTHKKAGVTLNLKNMIGIIHGKAFIPHHRPGPLPQGDSFPVCPPRTFVAKRRIARILTRSEPLYLSIRWLVRLVTRPLRLSGKQYAEWGEWYGNDTIWRTILDVNRILLYADSTGTMREKKQREYFCFVDGIVAMEGDGPMGGDPVPAGVVLAGSDPVAVDTVAAEIMGFDSAQIRTIHAAGRSGKYALGTSDLRQIKVVAAKDAGLRASFRFKAAPGWTGHIEREGGLARTGDQQVGSGV